MQLFVIMDNEIRVDDDDNETGFTTDDDGEGINWLVDR